MASIVPSERLRRELDEVIGGVGEEDDPIEAIGRLGARLILQQALEEELSEFLGRERYERRGAPVSHRNGYERVTVKTTAGPLELERPRVRNASALGFASAIVGKGVARTHALEALVVCSFLRGLSVRDVEAALGEAFEQPVVSKSTVARICASTRERYRGWCERHLSEHDLVYWRILDEASSAADAKAGLLALAADYRRAYPAAMAAIERDLDALVSHLRFPSEHRKRIRSTNLLERTLRRGPAADEGDRSLPRRDLGALPDLGRARALLARLARRRHDTARGRRDRTAPPGSRRGNRQPDQGGDRSLGSRPSGATPRRFHPDAGTPPRFAGRAARALAPERSSALALLKGCCSRSPPGRGLRRRSPSTRVCKPRSEAVRAYGRCTASPASSARTARPSPLASMPAPLRSVPSTRPRAER